MPRTLGILDYVKEAFLDKWNAVLFALGMGAGIVTLRPDLFWPPVIALELLFLLVLSQNRRFQRACAAKETAREAWEQAQKFHETVGRLGAADRARFERLRQRCEGLLSSADQAGAGRADLLGGERVTSTNQLLWMFVRALTYKMALERFVDPKTEKELRDRIRKLETDSAAPGLLDRARKAMEENRKVVEDRLANYERAGANLRVVEAELGRIEDLASLALERSLTTASLGDLNAQVSGVSQELESMERVLRDVMGDAPAITMPDAIAPEILSRPVPTGTRTA